MNNIPLRLMISMTTYCYSIEIAFDIGALVAPVLLHNSFISIIGYPSLFTRINAFDIIF